MFNHHAILLLGSSLEDTSLDFSKEREVSEFLLLSFETLSISEVRSLIQMAFLKPFSKPTKTIVIEASNIAFEAQHALLKVLEEPPVTTKFIFVLKSFEGLLPTLLSRFYQPTVDLAVKTANVFFSEFLKLNLGKRLEIITKITKDKDVLKIDQLREGLIFWLDNNKSFPKNASLLEFLSLMQLRGSSKKMLLEEIALTLPVES